MSSNIKVGDIVTYKELWALIAQFKGKVIEVGGLPTSGDVVVNWFYPFNSYLPKDNRCRECSFNLKRVED